MHNYHTLKKILLPNKDVRPLAFIISILLSLVWFAKNQPINIDSITYLQLAQTFLDNGMRVFENFNWPFYPIMIGGVSKLFGINLLTAGNVLNILLFGLIIISFISILRTLGFSLTCQCIAALVILFYPLLAHERADFLRDYGFYAFMLFGFNAVLRFELKRRWRSLAAWIAYTLLAGLFRIEGFTFLLILPLALFFLQFHPIDNSAHHSVHRCGRFNLLIIYTAILLCLILLYFLIVIKNSNPKLQALITSDFTSIATNSLKQFQNHKLILKEHLLTVFSSPNAGVILISGALGIVIFTIFKTMLPFHFFLSAYGWKKRSLSLTKNQKIIFAFYLLIGFIILFGFAFQHLFLTDRYAMFVAFILFLPIAPAIESFYYSHKNYFLFIVLLLLISIILSTVHIGVDKHYYIQSAEWVNQNLPPKARIYMNDPRLTFYVKRHGTRFPDDFPFGVEYTLIQQFQIFHTKNFDYALVIINKKNIPEAEALAASFHISLIQQFVNNRGDYILLYRINDP